MGEELEAKFARFKSFSARKVIDLLTLEQHTQWLKRLKKVKQHFKKDQNYQLWEESFHPQ
jgi:hypothetical protein